MQTKKDGRTISQVARMAGISVRALHHYDAIGLLRPLSRTPAGYRLYTQADLLRLQQILFYRELDMPLAEIAQVLDDPAFDPLRALAEHRRQLQARAARIERLLGTIERTMSKLTENDMDDDKVTDAELYAGFTAEQRAQIEEEVQQRWDPAIVAESNRRARAMSKSQWAALKQEGEDVERGLAGLIDRDPANTAVQALIARHFAMMNQFYPVTPDMYRGLGAMYVSDDRFRAHYEQIAPGLADFMQAAIEVYAAGLADAF
jgi:DNA-binding transcriptional MerR regulator